MRSTPFVVYKWMTICGLFMFVVSTTLLLSDPNFVHSQKTFDFAHTLILFGVLLTAACSFIFPKDIFNSIATPITILGLTAYTGMCTIDFILWSYGNNQTDRSNLIEHLHNNKMIWNIFFTIGPALYFIGITTQVWRYIKTKSILAAIIILSSSAIGAGQFLLKNEAVVMVGHLIFLTGMIILIIPLSSKSTNI